MALDPQDARLTAYAMGELDPREAALFEELLAKSPEAARAVVEIRRTGELISQALRLEPAMGAAPAELNAASRAMILTAAADDKTSATAHNPAPGRSAAPRPTSPRRRLASWARRHRITVGLVAMAVCATAAVLPATWVAQESAKRREQLAQRDVSQYTVPYAMSTDGMQMSEGHLGDLYSDPSSNQPGDRLHAIAGQKPVSAAGYESVPLFNPVPSDSPTPKDGRPWGDNEDALRIKVVGSAGQNTEGKPGEAQAGEKQSGRLMLGVGSDSNSGPVNGAILEQNLPKSQAIKQLTDSEGQNAKNGDAQAPQSSNERLTELETQTQRESKAELTTNLHESPASSTKSLKLGLPALGKKENSSGKASGQPEVDHFYRPSTPDPRQSVALGRQGTNNLALIPNEAARPESRFGRESEVVGRQEAEDYAQIVENAFKNVGEEPLSTFSIDVDTASYSIVRRFLTQGTLPPPSAVRIEEMINYFHYSYPAPAEKAEDPFAAHADVVACPWAPNHRLVRIGIKGREIDADHRPMSNLVFLVDVSGSMQAANKLPLVKEGLRMLVEKLGENDSVAIVVYAGSSGLVLPPTNGTQKSTIIGAIDKLEAGGSTNGGAGVQLAYDTAVGAFIKGGANRVILATDGDFNVGTTDQGQLVDLIEQKAKSNVFLSVLGFGMGNLKDSTLEKLSDKGNGNYAYIDSQAEARKVLVEQLSGTLVTIAKDVKIQIEFNPAKVQSYRLIGYENRILAKEDFNDDRKDAGEIGAGHTVTALYEVIPVGAAAAIAAAAGVDPLEYQDPPKTPAAVATTGPGAGAPAAEARNKSQDLLMLKLRYKLPDSDTSKLLKYPVVDKDQSIGAAGDDCELAAAVAAFGMQLRGSAHKGTVNYAMILELAEGAVGEDKEGYRREFVDLVKRAQAMGR